MLQNSSITYRHNVIFDLLNVPSRPLCFILFCEKSLLRNYKCQTKQDETPMYFTFVEVL